MLALEIRINGELKATCGAEDAEWLTASLMAKRNAATAPKDSAFAIQCVGSRTIDSKTREVLKWLEARLKFGDEISLRFVEATQVLEPMDRQAIPVDGLPPDA
jgi:hypothetical protein